MPTYASSNNRLANGRYLYIATNSLVTRSTAGDATYWSVIARDQLIDRSPALRVPTSTNNNAQWCHNQRCGGTLGDGTEECPTEAFNMRISCPMVES